MKRSRFVLTIALWAVLLVVLNGVVVAYAWQRMHPPSNLPELYSVPPFSLIDQDGRAVSDQSLRGKVWIADFVFTECAGTCPIMSSKMADLQSRLKDPRVKLVSFTVDPQHDTPAVLKEYAGRYKADSSHWEFLTGSVPQMNDLAFGMKISIEPAVGNNPLQHSTYFLLVDAKGMVRAIYDNNHPAPGKGIDDLANDAMALAREQAH